MSRSRDIHDDARVLLGIPPHDGGGNFCQGDGYFAADCGRRWGEVAFNAACAEVRAQHARGMAAYRAALQ